MAKRSFKAFGLLAISLRAIGAVVSVACTDSTRSPRTHALKMKGTKICDYAGLTPLGGTGAASTFYDAIDFNANRNAGGMAQAIAGLATSINMEWNGYLDGAADYLVPDK